ncbi:response regulator [Rhizobium sp. C4]|uniref:response regulator n=1 Tax=Rhizobium sp. C4 TaxID=1349800 RepID=UPI001E44C7BB|nr:response regulator [Rhizobium sp. C4]MCD2175206.1 response regulator [Rhizobium sp. C4]
MSLEPVRVLVIEDDPIDFSLVKKGFEGVDAPVELFHCPSADRVKEMLEARACRIVLLDLSLGRDTGMDVLRSIRADARFSTLPVIVLSSSTNHRDISEGYAAGANAYVEKPLTMELYRRFARSFVAFWVDVAVLT